VIWALALFAVSVAPSFSGMSGIVYLVGAIAASLAMLAMSVRFYFDRSNKTAMKLFMTSNFYLIVVMTMLVISART
jgi:protoheme IX farnesyltransferase